MSLIKKYNYEESKISSIINDAYGGPYLWLAFESLTDTCLLKKVSAFDPYQTYYNLDIPASKIVKMYTDTTSYLYMAVENSSYLGYRYQKNNPNGTVVNYTRPSGLLEMPIDILLDNTYVYFLMPGKITGEVSKIIKYTKSGTYNQTIILTKSGEDIKNAIGFTLDGDIWIVTDENPSRLVRVYDAGGYYDFQITTLS